MRLDYDFIKAFFEKEKYVLLSKEYINRIQKLEYICPEGHRHNTTWNNWNNGHRCKWCAIKNRANTQKLNFEFVKKFFEKEGYVLLAKRYINNKRKMKYICPNGHRHEISWNAFKKGQRCPHCSNVVKPSIEFIKSEFENENYKLLSDEYKNCREKLKYICPNNHHHQISWDDWKRGNRCGLCYDINRFGHGNPNWKGGYWLDNIPTFETYAYKISYAEQIRRSTDDKNILEVKCAYCGKWYIPSLLSVRSRIASLEGNGFGEARLYCSDGCKEACPIYRKHKYPAGYRKATSREAQPELRQLVFKRDNWTCQKCGSITELHCHHITGIKQNPIESADLDNCITLCKKCHKWVHSQKGCTYFEMRCSDGK